VLASEYQRCEDSERLATTPIRKSNRPRRYNNDAVKPLAASTTEDTEDTPEEEGSDCQTRRRNINFPTIRQSLSIAQKRALKEMKAEKSISKASKNQQKHTVSVRREDIEVVVRAIHSDGFGAVSNDGHPLSTDKAIEQVVKGILGSYQRSRSIGLLFSDHWQRGEISSRRTDSRKGLKTTK
jgi:hypothetical protein